MLLFFFVRHHFYFPAPLVGGFTLSVLLDKPWSQVASAVPSSPPYAPSFFVAHTVQHTTNNPQLVLVRTSYEYVYPTAQRAAGVSLSTREHERQPVRRT